MKVNESGRGRGWGDLGEWHWNMYNIMYETSRQSSLDAWYWMLGAGALGRPRGRIWGRRREEGSGWGAQVYLWRIHFDVWQNEYNIVKFKNKTKLRTTTTKKRSSGDVSQLFPWHLGHHSFWISSCLYPQHSFLVPFMNSSPIDCLSRCVYAWEAFILCLFSLKKFLLMGTNETEWLYTKKI